ncbi:MAG: L,D-transpeptidase family protein [Candidatus Parcubacteria bacterium]|nr:L,D-transpeptidase family protein [Candidatus Parcubacteria bacterium]
MKNVKIIILLTFLSLFFAFNVKAETLPAEQNVRPRPTIRIFNLQTLRAEKDIYPFDENSTVEGLNIAVADLDNDKKQEIIVAAGQNEKPLVKILDNQGNFKSEFLAYGEDYKGGIKAIAADLYNDGLLEIITAQNEEGNSEIRVFDCFGKKLFSFLAFDKELTGGASISAGDVNLDGQREIIVGAGYGQEGVVKIFSNYSNFLSSFYAYEKSFKGGVNVLAADINNDKSAEIITAPLTGKEPKIKIFNNNGKLQNEFLAYDKSFSGGVNLASGDIDNDSQIEILTGPGFGGGAHFRAFAANGQLKIDPRVFVYAGFRGGISIAQDDINNNNKNEIIAATQKIPPLKAIEIDLSRQKLFAYSNGVLEKEFIISTGKWKFPTPVGNFKINTKVLKTNMVRNYGLDNPDNYNLPNVPNVMYFYRDYAIHGAYWHWKFGTRVSHGCVNLKLKDAEWLYNWTPLNTPVNIYSSVKKL